MAEQTSSEQATCGLSRLPDRLPILSTAQPMWCPCCQSRSPLVAIQPEGLICAQCQVEVEFGDPTNAPIVEAVSLSGSRLQIAEAAAELQLGLVEDVTLSTLEEFQTLSFRSAEGPEGAGAAPAATRLATQRPDSFNRSRRSGSPTPPAALTSLPADQPLFRFDSAHPPVGGRTKTAIDQQRAKFNENQRTVRPLVVSSGAVSSPATAPAASPASAAGAGSELPPNRASESLASSFKAAAPANVAAPASDSEFAIRRVPRSFLLPRSNNRWPGRLCLLSGSLFIAGQSWLLWSFLRGESWGVAGGILATAWSFAMALYIIARYCDEDLEQA